MGKLFIYATETECAITLLYILHRVALYSYRPYRIFSKEETLETIKWKADRKDTSWKASLYEDKMLIFRGTQKLENQFFLTLRIIEWLEKHLTPWNIVTV